MELPTEQQNVIRLKFCDNHDNLLQCCVVFCVVFLRKVYHEVVAILPAVVETYSKNIQNKNFKLLAAIPH